MPRDKCIILLSEKSSGSSPCQRLLAKAADIKHVSKTRHSQKETLYWVKAASILGKPQVEMVNSEVPIKQGKARRDLVALLTDNLDDFAPPETDKALIMNGWRALCRRYAPVFLEKSPHHLCQWSALELILQCMKELEDIDFLLIGLVRNPLDTIYSQYKRWGSPPGKVQAQWVVAYQNLLRLKTILGEKLLILRYEDIVQSIHHLEPVFRFCGVKTTTVDNDLHARSIRKWQDDTLFGYSLSPDAIALAEDYGYKKDELINTKAQLLWPVISCLSHAAHITSRPLRKLKQNARKFRFRT